MWVWLINSIFTPIGEWFASVLAADLLQFLKNWYATYKKQKQGESDGQNNVDNEKKAVEGGDPNAIAQTGGDVLNGTPPHP